LVAGTTYVLDYERGYHGDDPHDRVTKTLAQASGKTFAALKQVHTADYQAYFHRLVLDLGTSEARYRPTDERLRDFGDGRHDPSLVTLFYQYGRYLMISSSRLDNPLPSNSQGIWGDGLDLPWKCDVRAR
jgi:alpha-L-fucosidase 2